MSAAAVLQVNSASSLALCRLVPAQRRVAKLSPIQLLKAVKNSVELQGMRNCHVSWWNVVNVVASRVCVCVSLLGAGLCCCV